jgi:hypothetical protein
MAGEEGARREPRQLTELSNVHEFLDQTRLRPSSGYDAAHSNTWTRC